MNDDRIWSSYVRGLRLQQRSKHTIRNYEQTVRLFRRYLKGMPLVEAGRNEIEGFLTERLESCQGSTVHGDFVNLRPFYNWMVEEEYISKSPLTRIKPPVVEDKAPRVLSDAELGRLFKSCQGTRFYDRRDEAMLRVMSEIGGPRRGEMAAMSVDDIDFSHDLIHLVGKTGERWIPFGAKTGVALEKYLRQRDKQRHASLPNLWLSYRGAVPIQTLWWVVRRHGHQAGLGNLYPHILRHTAAHRAHDAGMSEADMEALFGWTPGSAMTRLYGRSTKILRAQNSSRRLNLGDKF